MTSLSNCNSKTGKWAPNNSSGSDQNYSSSVALVTRSQLNEQAFNLEEQQHIRKAIREKYQKVSQSAEGSFSYPTGKKGAINLKYDSRILSALADDALKSFCGVGNPFSISSIPADSKVLDIGCGAGFDLLVASKIVGDQGHVCGIDLTEEMVKKAHLFVKTFGAENISVQHVSKEKIPYSNECFDFVISNGVFNLSPSKLELFREIFRVLKPNGILQFADVSLIMNSKPSDLATSVEEWAQWIGGTISVRDQITLLEKAGFHSVECVGSSGVKTSQHTESTLFKSVKPQWIPPPKTGIQRTIQATAATREPLFSPETKGADTSQDCPQELMPSSLEF